MMGSNYQLRRAKPARPHTNRPPGYRKGSFLRICDRSGQTYDARDTRKEWNGLIVGKDEWEIRHPQDFVRGIKERIASPEPRPQIDPTATLSLSISDITASSGAVAGGVYTSGAIDNTRPLVFWTLALGASTDLASIAFTDIIFSGSPPVQIREGVYIEYSTDGSTYTRLLSAVNEFDNGVTQGEQDITVNVNQTATHIRLVLAGGAGLGYTGTLSHGAISLAQAN